MDKHGGAAGVQPLARGLRAKGGAVAFANFENAKWPVAEVSRSHALIRVTVAARGVPAIPRTECMANEYVCAHDECRRLASNFY